MAVTRKVGSLTNRDLGSSIRINGEPMLVIAVKHTVDEAWGNEYTVVYDNAMQVHGRTYDSDQPFEVVRSEVV